MAKKQNLNEFVGGMVRIEKDGIAHEGLLTGPADQYADADQKPTGEWLLFSADDFANTSEHRFLPNDGWTITAIEDA